MAKPTSGSLHSQRFGVGRILTWLMGLVSFGILAFFIVAVVTRFTTPPDPHPLQLVRDVPLPGIIKIPGQPDIHTVSSDHFDFQALDPQAGLLFIAHSGPSPSKFLTVKQTLPSKTQVDGTIVVFDTKRDIVIESIKLPNIHGIVVAHDLGRVYAASAFDDTVYSIDEQTRQIIKKINLDSKPCPSLQADPPAPCESPDSIEYDQADHKIFVSCPRGQNEVVIDTQTDMVKTIDLSGDKSGDTVGHTRYDPVSKQIFVVVQPLQLDPNNSNSPWPPAKLVTINPVSDSVDTPATMTLPTGCMNAHGLVLDSQQRIAFVACMDSQPNPNVWMMNLQTMSIIGNPQRVGIKPDILALDSILHILYVASNTSISIFDESAASKGLLNLSQDAVIGSGSSHTMAVDETTHYVYVPQADVQGQPLLWIEVYNPPSKH